MLGLARRAGKLSMGHDLALEAVKKRKAKLIIFSSDVSPRLINEFKKASGQYKPELPCLKIEETMDEIHSALGYRAGVFTVNDINFSDRILELVDEYEI